MDLGYLLHKNPTKLHSFELSFGKAHVFYPEATAEKCTAALLLDVDPVGLVRGKRGMREGGTLDQYVNDRPYVLSSFLSVAMGRAFGTAMSGRSKGRQELADLPIPLTANLAVVACRAGEGLIRELFEPLGYSVVAQQHPLDEKFPEWGEGPYYSVTLTGTFRLQDLLNHLYVLVPVLDAEKHYWIGQDEIEKLLRKGEGWLASHPHKETIVKRYLPGRRQLAREALARLTEEDNPDPDATEEAHAEKETKMEEPIRLWQQRMGAVVAVRFHLLASESGAHTANNHVWHMETLARICATDPELLLATPFRVVDLTDKTDQQKGIQWWEELTASGGEGMVVKPLEFVVKGRKGLAQPAVKVRGREYLRIIFGPEYTLPENLERLKSRSLGTKRSLALREFALGLEALERFVHKEPLRRVHECVFGVLALESEPVDPRL